MFTEHRRTSSFTCAFRRKQRAESVIRPTVLPSNVRASTSTYRMIFDHVHTATRMSNNRFSHSTEITGWKSSSFALITDSTGVVVVAWAVDLRRVKCICYSLVTIISGLSIVRRFGTIAWLKRKIFSLVVLWQKREIFAAGFIARVVSDVPWIPGYVSWKKGQNCRRLHCGLASSYMQLMI